MALNELNFKLFNLYSDLKILKESERNYYAYLPFFPGKTNDLESPYGYIEAYEQVIHNFSKEEWSSLMCITC